MTASIVLPQPMTGTASASLPYDWPHRDRSQLFVSEGSTWHVQRMGQGETLLLLHGTAASTHTWRDVMPALAASFDVVAVDLPGHGFSERLIGEGMSLDDISSSLAGLLEDMAISPLGIVGHSAGAAIALNLVLKEHVAARNVVGINAALLPFGGALRNVFSPLAQFFASTHLMPRMLARRAGDQRAVERVLKGTGSTLDAVGMNLYQRLFQRESHLSSVLKMMASWELDPLLEHLPRLDSRLLLVVGEKDLAVSPKEADSIAQMVDNAGVVRLPGVGHLAHEEVPQRVAGLIRQFIEADEPDV